MAESPSSTRRRSPRLARKRSSRSQSRPRPVRSLRTAGSEARSAPVDFERFITFDELPEWAAVFGSRHIPNGYRPTPTNSLRACFRSICTAHNETANIWTHLIPSIFYFSAFVSRALGRDAKKREMLLFLICGVGFLASALFHTCVNHSERVAKRCVRIDMVCIVFMLTANCTVIIWNLLACEPERRAYTMARIGVGAGGLAVVVVRREFTHPKYKKYKPLFFIALGLCLMEPMVTWAGQAHSPADAAIKTQVVNALRAGWLMMVLSATAYVARLPERMEPGLFDYVGNSHNIFHCLAVVGSFFGWVAGNSAGSTDWCRGGV